MKKLKVVSVNPDSIVFENNIKLYSNHDGECCETHELNFEDLTMIDFEGLEFDLSGESFFNRIPDYGIELVPVKGHSVKIAGHGHNNGYYSDQLDLVLTNGNDFNKIFDITECQVITD